MKHDNVFAWKNPAVANEVCDALTEVLEKEPGRCWRRRSKRSWQSFWQGMPISEMGRVDRGWCVTGTGQPERTVQTGSWRGDGEGACPGWVVDHLQALKQGGADDPSNMQWQTRSGKDQGSSGVEQDA